MRLSPDYVNRQKGIRREILLDGHHVKITAAGIRAVETQTTNHQGE